MVVERWTWHIGGIVLCPWLRHFILCLLLVQLGKSGKCPKTTEKLLTRILSINTTQINNKDQESIQTNAPTGPGHNMGKWHKHKKHHKQENQEVSQSTAGDHEAARNRQDSLLWNTNKNRDPQKKHRLWMVSNKISGGLKLFDGTNLTLIYCNGSRHIDVCFALTSPNIDISSPSTYTSRYKNDINKHNDSTVQTDAYRSKGNPTVNPRWALPLTQHQALNFSSTEQNETSWFTLYHILTNIIS